MGGVVRDIIEMSEKATKKEYHTKCVVRCFSLNETKESSLEFREGKNFLEKM
jgi:hypothetical protein